MKDNDILEKILDDIIEEASYIAVENIGQGIEDGEEVEFSREHEKKMQILFKRERRKAFYKNFSQYSKRAAIFILVFITVSGVSILSVSAWRARVLNFVLDMNPTYSDIIFEEDSEEANTMLEEIFNQVSFGYIPDGFEIENYDDPEIGLSLKYAKDSEYFRFTSNSIEGSHSIDTEDAEVRDLKINDNEAVFSIKSNVKILVWHDSINIYVLTGNIEEAEIIKIAENITVNVE